VNVGTTTHLPLPSAKSEKVSVTTSTGEVVEVENQLHMYAQNSLLVHPLVSPALGYLGGLPPLLMISSDKEVLRDEAIYL
jgi:acetyl esterase/lipase